ncbi:hypothetical protein D9M68_780840 [compost metagenome]
MRCSEDAIPVARKGGVRFVNATQIGLDEFLHAGERSRAINPDRWQQFRIIVRCLSNTSNEPGPKKVDRRRLHLWDKVRSNAKAQRIDDALVVILGLEIRQIGGDYHRLAMRLDLALVSIA